MDEAQRAPDAPRGGRMSSVRRPTLKVTLGIAAVVTAVCLAILLLVLRGLPGTGGVREAPAVRPAATAERVPPSPRGVYRVTGRVQLDELPTEFFLPPASGLVAEELLEKRDLVLDGAVLLVGEGAANGRYRQLVANIVRLEDGARIVTNGARFEILANQIVSQGGQVIGFEFVEAALRAAGPAAARPTSAPAAATPAGRRRNRREPEPVADPLRPSTAAPELGTHGADGGVVRLVTLSPLQGRLTVRLNGQDGAPGEPGEDGYSETTVRSGGGDAIGDLIDCSGGGGSRSVPGGPGGQGGAGGNGGGGGVLELVGAIGGSREQVTFQGEPGVAGQGGPGGRGGAGGAIQNTACGYGSAAAGPPGPDGLPGPTGELAVAGRVVVVPEIE